SFSSMLSIFHLLSILFLLLSPPPPISTLFPYTTLFRSPCRNSPSGSPAASPAASRWWKHSSAPWACRCLMPIKSRVMLSPRLRRSEEHTSELQSPYDLVCRLLLEKKKKNKNTITLISQH